MAMTEALAGFFDTGAHAGAATYTPSGGSASTVNVIFNDDYLAIPGGMMVEVEGSTPVAVVRSSDVSNVAQGDAVVINSVTYSVVGVRPDGTGITELAIEAA